MFQFRAIKKANVNRDNYWYNFKLSDCPVILWDNLFSLAVDRITPICIYDTIVRGHPTKDIFEGDYVICSDTNKCIGIVTYSNGFKVQNLDGLGIKYYTPEHIYLKKGDSTSVKLLNNDFRTPILFSYEDEVFDFRNFVRVNDNFLYILKYGKFSKIDINLIKPLLKYNGDYKVYKFEGEISM